MRTPRAVDLLNEDEGPLKIFKRSLSNIYFIKKRGPKVIEQIEDECAAVEKEVNDIDAQITQEKREAATAEILKSLTAGMKQRDERLTELLAELDTWRLESARRTAVAYCTAFEAFLRDFLVWQLHLKPERLEKYARQKLKLPLVIREKYLSVDTIDECVARECQTFQDLVGGRVSSAYDELLGVGKVLTEFKKCRNYEDKDKWKSALRDIRLLIEIRHKIVHRNGKSDKKYHNQLNNLACRPRLNGSYFTSWAENYDQIKFPEPDDILASPACDAPGKDKLDEISDSLTYYAGYIVEACQ